MINFRFHIVSLTAVLLALGMGLVLGTAFLDDAVVNALKRQLDGLEGDLVEERARADGFRNDLDVVDHEHELLDEELASHVVGGSLTGQPVLLISRDGIDRELADRALGAFAEADADVLGMWELGSDFNLDNDEKVGRLAEALDVPTEDADRLRESVLQQLSDVLYGATEVAEEPVDAVEPAAPHEPDLLVRLREAGFVDYRFGQDSDADVVELPPAGGVRVVMVDGPGSDVSMSVLVDLLDGVASNGPVPVVVSAPGQLALAEDEEEEGAGVAPLIAAVREDDDLSERVSTVDNFDRAAGKVATVLASEAAAPGSPEIGRYGQGDGVEQLLPQSTAPEEPSE